ncbi:WD40/YVTN/BNR-like repeat-containing protein [Maritalea sp.]|uniref:WD40/YVTN/BNR-like repeat-containing protein n=1 Tax=Maritalea sp. TaxID=2003361 RepID=UPI003EF5F289
MATKSEMVNRDDAHSPEKADLVSSGLNWRCIGPPRGGRVVAVAGDPIDPMTFYFGACAGGVWKTEDGGTLWENVSDGYFNSATVGALAVSESDPNVIYAGMGETTIRIDVSYGDGVYKSTDGGESWTHLSLEETRHIAEIRIHPDDPDIVYVAAFGHAFGKNKERGIYRSFDGGENWELVLHESDGAGAIDLAMDPNNPRHLMATTWEAHRHFWTLSSGGPGSKIYRSKDGGDTWENITDRPGFAKGMLGKMGVAISPAQSGRVWALVEAKGIEGALYRSDNFGDSWERVSPNRDLLHRPWYYMHVFADTTNPDTVYVTNYQMWKSTDGGRNFDEITTPHGDNHDLWIDPVNNQRMVQGNDGGGNVSFNGGKTWTSIYNQPTAQFYRMDIDNQYPYRLYATQQDNTSISVPSATEWGAITLGDCTYPGTGESGFIAVHPDDANIVYVGAVGSSPGGSGALQRYDQRTKQSQLINVWPEENTGFRPRDLKYRFAWTFPIHFSPHDSNVIYAGGNHVFKTTDEGKSWTVISPDLSLNDPEKLGYSGGPLTGDSAGAETYASLSTFVESVHRQGELWAGTDDGLIHVSRDAGANWQNVTPPDLPELAYIGSIEVCAQNPDKIYVAATRFKLDDYSPYLYLSNDSGKSWKSINGDMPKGEITRVLRSDPVSADLLFVGTETGIFYSLDDGEDWVRMDGGFPVVPVYDIKIKNEDLAVATHGRSFWIADDVTPLREMAKKHDVTHGEMLFKPRDTVRQKLHWATGVFDGDGKNYSPAFGVGGTTFNKPQSDGTTKNVHYDVGENPPNGAIIYYWFDEKPEGLVELIFKSEDGEVIATFSSDEDEKPNRKITKHAGLNRFIWDLHLSAPTPFDQSLINKPYEPLAKSGDGRGPRVSTGTYLVELDAEGAKIEQQFAVVKDPRVEVTQDELDQQFNELNMLHDCQSRLREGVNSLRYLRQQLDGLERKMGKGHKGLVEEAAKIGEQLTGIEGALVNRFKETPRDVLRHPAGLDDTLGELAWALSIADTAPTLQVVEVSEDVRAKVAAQLAELQTIIDGPIAALNTEIGKSGVPAISI